jgi:Flp pilus assembly pilin Flp
MRRQGRRFPSLLGTVEENREPVGRDHDRGAIMAEYAYLIVGIALVVGIAAAALGVRLAPLYESVVFP